MLQQVARIGPPVLGRLPAAAVRPLDQMEADLYSPQGLGPRPGIVLLLGALTEGRAYPPLAGLAAAIARAGYVVLVPELGRLRELVLGPAAVDDSVRAAELLARQPEVRPGPVGLYGFSVGASLALLAAARAGTGTVAFAAALGGYFSLEQLIAEATCGTGAVQLERTTVYTTARSVVELLAATPGRELLRQALESAPDYPLGALARIDPLQVEDEVRPALALLQNRAPARVPGLLANLDPALRRSLEILSPAAQIGRLQVPAWILHDRDDPYIPVAHTEALRQDPRAAGFHVDVTTLIQHTELAPLTPASLVRVYLPNLRRLHRFAASPLRLLSD